MNTFVAVVFCLLVVVTEGFYLPGVSPHSYQPGENVELKVNKLTSVHTLLPYEYYSLKFCRPVDGVKSYSENLGEFLRGDRIENSAYSVEMLKEVYCRGVCERTLKQKDVKDFQYAISNRYHHNWIMDNLPAASILDDDSFITTDYVGYPVGFEQDGEQYLFNHANIIVEYHAVEDGNRIVGFYVEPLSIKHNWLTGEWDGKGAPPDLATCSQTKHLSYDDIKKGQSMKLAAGRVIFSYGVEWRPSDVAWASRWDIYLSMNHAVPNKVHWFSITNSFLVVLFLSFMIAMIVMRTIHRDISHYNRLATDEEKAEEREETGWKLVHADVFRAPTTLPILYCAAVGTGAQLSVWAFFLILIAALGYLSPANRGSLMIASLLIFALCGSIAGYTSARFYKTFKGKQWQRCTLITALGFPGLVFLVFFVLDLMVWSYGSTGAVPFLSMLAVVTLWMGVSLPLVFLGAYFGYRKDSFEFPVVTSNIPRQIPVQPFYLHPLITCFLGGVLPFGACFVELFFVMSSVWMDQYYYVFGFLFVVYVILAVTSAEITAVLVYFQLCSEDYHWWWRSFFCSGSIALYIFAYATVYFSNLESTMIITYCLYFGYMGLGSIAIGLIVGSLGSFASLALNCAMYASIKVD